MALKYFLIDVDGVLYNGSTVVDGAVHALRFLRESGLKFQLLTNTSGKTALAVKEKLNGMGFDIFESDIYAAANAMIDFIRKKKKAARCYLVGTVSLEQAMIDAGLKVTRKEEPVDFVVLAYDSEVTYQKLDIALRLLLGGAGFIATHQMKIYPNETGVHINVGAFAKALEYASGKAAYTIGKPNPDFFLDSMRRIKARKEETAMVGDDIFEDIKGAQDCGLKAIFVESGSYKKDDLEKNGIRPDFSLKSIKDIQPIINA